MTQVLTLQLIKGIEPSMYKLGATGTSYEADPFVVDFLTGVWKLKDEAGVSAYDPGIAGLKNGGVSVDSALVDGILPIAGPYGVVTDGIRVVSKHPAASRATALRELHDTIRAGNDFWYASYQLDPVYLKVQLVGDAGPRYALIYDVQTDEVGDMLENEPRELILTVLREPFWRPIAPGANPKLYTFDRRGLVPGVDYDYQDLNLDDFNNANANLRNALEADIANADSFSSVAITYNNYLDVDDVPGDAPALICLSVNELAAFGANNLIYVARNSKPGVESTSPEPASMNLNGGDATIPAPPAGVTSITYTVNASGIRCDPPGISAENYYHSTIVYSAGAITAGDLMRWQRVLLKNHGRYRVFVRGRVSVGLASNMQFQIVLVVGDAGAAGVSGYTVLEQTPPFNPQATALPSLQEVGNFDLSRAGRVASIDGVHFQNDMPFTLALQSVARGATAAATYTLFDIILLPYDEYACATPFSASVLNGTALDNTGYFLHGQPADGAYVWVTNATPNYVETQRVLGRIPVLEPKKPNRLYFLLGDSAESGGMSGSFIRTRLNYVPRWRHLRDEV